MCPAEVFKYFYDGQSVIDKVKQEVMNTIEA
jgi:CheY-like chemotaxis protein